MATNPREHARRVLDTFWCGRGFPVDPAKIAHDMGLDVFYYRSSWESFLAH